MQIYVFYLLTSTGRFGCEEERFQWNGVDDKQIGKEIRKKSFEMSGESAVNNTLNYLGDKGKVRYWSITRQIFLGE